MSMNSFVKSQAAKIGEAVEFKAKAAKVNKQVMTILEAIGNDEKIDLSRDRLDPELYAELESMGIIKKAREAGLLREPRPTVATSKQSVKWDHDETVVENDDDEDEEDKHGDVQSRLGHIDRRIAAIDDFLKEEDIDGELFEEYKEEKRELLEQREKIAAEKKRKQQGPPEQEVEHKKAKLAGQKRLEGERKAKAAGRFWSAPRKGADE